MKKLAAAVALFSAVSAQAFPVLDFEGASGQVQDYYNGGTDSMGNTGPNYGIHFDGGTVFQGSTGKYVSGNFTMTFAPHADLRRISFQGTRWDIDGGNVWAYAPDGANPTWVQGIMNPSCAMISSEECLRRGFLYIPPDKLFDYRTQSDFMSQVFKVVFTTNLADNITFMSDTWSAADPAGTASGEVPLPGTPSLLALGVCAILLARKTIPA